MERIDQKEIIRYHHSASKQRLWLVAGTHVGFWTGSYIALNKAWYADYPRESFHFFNDLKEWKQMDKVGHIWTAYHLNSISTEMWKWAGLNERKAVLFGGLSSIAYQSIIEIQDAHSPKWGFSWSDIVSNFAGVAIYSSQQLGWKEQRIHIKMGFTPYNYSGDVKERRNELFGKSLPERILKDYNSQTYWASLNIQSMLPDSKLPRWLNIAIGYGADGLLGGTENKWTDKNGNHFDRTDIKRTRQFYISPDIDLSKIKTRKRFVRSLLFVVNAFKVPAPALGLSNGKLKGYWLVF